MIITLLTNQTQEEITESQYLIEFRMKKHSQFLGGYNLNKRIYD